MKSPIALSSQKMHRLHALGLDCSDASMVWLAPMDNMTDETLTTIEQAIKQSDRWAYTPAYTLEDILMKLPEKINGAWLDMCAINAPDWTVCYEEWDKHGDLVVYQESHFMDFELIGALYRLLCWVLENHPDKIKKL